jgi:hypothetical protein
MRKIAKTISCQTIYLTILSANRKAEATFAIQAYRISKTEIAFEKGKFTFLDSIFGAITATLDAASPSSKTSIAQSDLEKITMKNKPKILKKAKIMAKSNIKHPTSVKLKVGDILSLSMITPPI